MEAQANVKRSKNIRSVAAAFLLAAAPLVVAERDWRGGDGGAAERPLHDTYRTPRDHRPDYREPAPPARHPRGYHHPGSPPGIAPRVRHRPGWNHRFDGLGRPAYEQAMPPPHRSNPPIYRSLQGREPIRGQQHNEAQQRGSHRQQPRRGVNEVIDMVERRYGGKVVGVESGADHYRVRLLQRDGRVRTLRVPAEGY